MKVLIAGNSQAGCLKKAFDKTCKNRFVAISTADWIVVPGGNGPYLRIENNKIKITAFDSRFPPRTSPNNDILANDINYYDSIIISALGYVDGGFYYDNKIATDTFFPISSIERNNSNPNEYPISENCFKDVAMNKLSMHPGFSFYNQLREFYKGTIFVQPFPMLSSKVKDRDDWHLAKLYKDPIAATHILLDMKDKHLRNICNHKNTILLPYPNQSWRLAGFTPSEYILESDYLHPNERYGELILVQIEELLQTSQQTDFK